MEEKSIKRGVSNMRIKVALLLCFATLLSNILVSAEIELVYSDYDSGFCYIKGVVNGAQNEAVAFQVLRPGKTVNSEGEPAQIYTAAKEIQTDSKGAFNHTFTMLGETGIYTARIGGQGQVYERSFIYVDASDVSKYLGMINTAKNAQEIKDVFEQDQGKLWSICQVNLDNYSVSNINYVYECIFEAKPSGGFTGLMAVKKVVLESILLENLAHTSDAEISAIIEKILPYIDEIYHGVTVVYNSSMISDGIKNNINSALRFSGAKTIQEYETLFAELTVYNSLKNASNQRVISRIIENTASFLDMPEIAFYLQLSESEQAVITSNMDNSYTGVSGFKASFAQSVENYKNGKYDKQPLSSDEGGSGGGRTGGVTNSYSGNIEVNFNPVEVQPKQMFSDIQNVAWAETAIETLAQMEIIQGRGNGMFDPDSSITREEFVKILILALELFDEDAQCSFEDVDKDQWYYKYIASAVEKDITKGISEEKFGVGINISRQDAATVCARAVESIGVVLSVEQAEGEEEENKNVSSFEYATIKTEDAEVAAAFSDAQSFAEYAKDSIEKMRTSGVISGMPDGAFYPEEPLTRAQAAVIIYGLMRL